MGYSLLYCLPKGDHMTILHLKNQDKHTTVSCRENALQLNRQHGEWLRVTGENGRKMFVRRDDISIIEEGS